MAPSTAGCRLFCVPDGVNQQDDAAGSKMAPRKREMGSREDKKAAGIQGWGSGSQKSRSGTQKSRWESK
jgi:hypothetical protein